MNSCKRVHLSEFERLVERYQDRVYGFACYMLGSRADAQDVTQDVLIRLWRRGGEVDDGRVFSWLMRVTRNACLDRLRHRKVVRGVVSGEVDVDGMANDDASPADRLEQADERAVLEGLLARLSEPYRSIVILREIQGMKYEEISGAMDLPLNTVKVYLHRGRKMLRKHLTEAIERERV